ncbi:myosin-binding protein 3-like [Euphorbia lathyris]|uniref:myosin-binding protein 3-like n=1 Tax=Euphorbia lathyris TaxID=212925 RepID=UPI003313399D
MASRNWTLSAIVTAFIDLAIAYTLLCGSAFAFIFSQLLSFFGINLPCPCTGFFWYQNNDLCWHKLLVDWPIRKIVAVEELIKSRFPYDFVMFEHKSCNSHMEGHGKRKFANGITELEEEACSTSLSGPTACESVDRESGCEAKGKKIINQKSKSGIRRRRRAVLGYGKVPPSLSSNSSDSVGVSVLHPFYDGSGIKSRFSESMDAESGKEDGFSGNPGDTLASGGNDANAIQVLERALEEEKAARAVLYQELEKERAAAASAADEAMAMMLRLQEDKASIQMEARQYHRVIEEKFNYDEEEMKILKEILVRREKEIHFLEKEVEAYEEMNFSGNEQVEGDLSYKLKNKEWRPSRSIDSTVNPILMPFQIDNTKESACGSASSQGLMHKKFSTEGKEKIEKDISIISPKLKAPPTCSIDEDLQKDGEDGNQEGCNICSSMLDTESTVYDVHVIDDKTVLSKADHQKENGRFSTAEFSSDCPNMGTDFSTAVDGERLKIDNEVEWLKERLRVVQEEKEKLAFSAEHSERVNAELKHVEDIVSQVREVHVKNPLRLASLLASSSNF